MVEFVLNGGGVIIIADNNQFGGHDPASPNGSLLSPFGFGIDGITAWPEPVTPTGLSWVTDGVGTFDVELGGLIDLVPPVATVLARRNTDGTPMMCAISRGSLAPGSGPVVVFGDISFLTDNFIVPWVGPILINNALTFVGPELSPCYANCDGSRCAGRLTANDFQCFLNRFAAGDPYANCDGSMVAPVLTANDFLCFLNAYAVGCS